MSEHIEKIAENLYALTARKMKPLIVAVDDENNFVSHYGELGDYKLPQFDKGQSCVEELPFLVGLEDEAYVTLPIVNFNDDNVSSVNIIKINSNRYVILLEAVDEYQREQQLTQSSNETKLLYQKLQQLTQQLEIANQTKSRFISGMSHEFRTPISSILGYSNLLACNDSLDANVIQHARAIERNAQYLLSLIDNVLEHAQLEAEKLIVNIAPFLLHDLIVNIGLMFGSDEKNAGLTFNLETSESLPEVIYSDQIRLQQILINVIGNAFKYTEKGSVTVSFDWHDEELVVKVTDSGPGIPIEHQKNIFQAYSRYNSGSKKGAGLGLSISAQLAEKLQGKLELKSQLGKGSVFTLMLKAKVGSADSIIKEIDISNNQAKRVLVVEDDEDLIELLKIYLHEYGYSTIFATNGNSALQQCENEAIDLVLLDMQLPKLSGIEVVKSLRSSKFKAPIIGMTASSNIDDKVKALEAGCDEFLSKPIQPTSLLTAINNILSHHG